MCTGPLGRRLNATPGRVKRPPKGRTKLTVNATAARSEQVRRYVENRHIDRIPDAARHGKPWQQLVFWFGGNVNVFNVVLGGVLVSIGLTFWWAVAALVIGTLIGALLIALHATQGPRLRVPQSS